MTHPELLTEKLSHAIDLLRSENQALRKELGHQKEIFEHRVARLERDTADQELRLRAATEGVTQFKQWSGLAAGGSSVISLIALIKAFFMP